MNCESLKVFVVSVLVATLVAGCGEGQAEDAAPATPEYIAEIEAFRVDRLARLKAENGYLNLAGLFWLREGSLSIRCCRR